MQKIVEVGYALGTKLTNEEIAIINHSRFKEFGSPVPIDPQKNNDEGRDLFFFAKVQEKIVAFGRLHDVTITFNDQQYNVYGIATIIAIEKGKGYGKKLMTGIKHFIENSGRTGLGFCAKKLSGFYKVCGYKILEDGQERFYAAQPPRFSDSDVFFIDGSEGLMKGMLREPDKKAALSRPHW